MCLDELGMRRLPDRRRGRCDIHSAWSQQRKVETMPSKFQQQAVMPSNRSDIGSAEPQSMSDRTWMRSQLILTRRICECVAADSLDGVECVLKTSVLEVVGAEEALARVIGDGLPNGYRPWAQQHLESVLSSAANREAFGAQCAVAVAWGRAWRRRVIEEPLQKVACFLLQPWRSEDMSDHSRESENDPGGCRFVICTQNVEAGDDQAAGGSTWIDPTDHGPMKNIVSRTWIRHGFARDRAFGSHRLQVVSVMAAAMLARAMRKCFDHDSIRVPS